MKRLTYSLLAVWLTLGGAYAQDTKTQPTELSMTLSRLAEIIFSLDENAQSSGNSFQMIIQDVPVLIITDPNAGRMRAMVPIRASNDMTPKEILRVMQANFDTALDARYAIAHGKLWGTFVHPLSSLQKNEFISALGQTVNIAKSYGTLYSGGALSFGGGDSIPLQRQLIDELLKKGEEI